MTLVILQLWSIKSSRQLINADSQSLYQKDSHLLKSIRGPESMVFF